MLGFRGLHFVKELCVNIWISAWIIEDDYEFDNILERILESMNLDEYKLIDLRRNSFHFGYSKYMNVVAGTT